MLPLELVHKETDKKVHQLLKKVGLEEKAKKYPKELSGGMQQIVSILRAIINNPAVLLLDEPLSAIDEINRNKLQDILIKLKDKETLAHMITLPKSNIHSVMA